MGHCERAQRASVAINRQGILMILALYTVDCFALLAMTRGSVHKVVSVMLSEAKHLYRFQDLCFSLVFISVYDSISWLFSSRGTGGLLAIASTKCLRVMIVSPLIPLKSPTPARFLNVRYACICHAPQRFVYVMPFGSNIDVARCGWDVEIGK